MLFERLEVKKFRHITNQVIELGTVMTAITGQNGTGKTTLLGWIAQSSDFKGSHKTLTGKPFSSKYSEIFKFCRKNDYKNAYEVILHYKNGKGESATKIMETRYISVDNRYRVDFDGMELQTNLRQKVKLHY